VSMFKFSTALFVTSLCGICVFVCV
jgi:hypothetical protein